MFEVDAVKKKINRCKKKHTEQNRCARHKVNEKNEMNVEREREGETPHFN